MNYELRTQNCRRRGRGFTLIELLVVIGILVVVVGSALLVLTAVLKGTNQANVTAEVKQNGQAVLDSLEKQIRNATVAEPVGSGKYLKLTQAASDPVHIKCFGDGGGVKTENGWIGVVTSATTPQDSAYISVTNKNDTVSGVDIQNCSFTVLALTTTSPSIVSLSFVVNQGVAAPSRVEFLANASFSTTISLRKY